jgi:hypothetical protein
MKRKSPKVHSQPRIKGITRTPSNTSVHPEMWNKIDKLAYSHGVSRSWVIATILADGLSFGQQVPYYEVSKPTKLRRVK